MILPTASQLQRVMACPGSWKPGNWPVEVTEPSEAMERGNAIHKYLENRVDGKDDLFEGVPEKYHDFCESITGLPFFTKIPLAEQAFSYDPINRVGRNLGKISREYPMVPGIFYGTADFIDWWDLANNEPVILDYKTGNSDVPEPKDNWQLRLLALARSRVANGVPCDDVIVGIVKIGEDGKAFTTTHRYTKADLKLFADELENLVSEIQLVGYFNRGDHCKYCPAFMYCPVQTAVIRNLAVNPEREIEDGVIRPLGKGDREQAYKNYKHIRMAMQRMESAMRSHAEALPIELDDVVFGPVSRTVESIDGEVAYASLEEKYGPEVALKACSFDVSKASIERAMALCAPKGKKALYVREALAEIANSGGIKVETRTEIRETKKK